VNAATEVEAMRVDLLAVLVALTATYREGGIRALARLALDEGLTTARECHTDPARCLVAVLATHRFGHASHVVTFGAYDCTVWRLRPGQAAPSRDGDYGVWLLSADVPVDLANAIAEFDGGAVDDLFPERIGGPAS
jgi:hypothetical protein